MNIQIFGRVKCFDTKKAQRYFKERRVKFQFVDLSKYEISRGELQSIKNAVGLDALIDDTVDGVEILRYFAYDDDRFQKLLEQQEFLKTPIVRNGKAATIGYCPDTWKAWQ